MKRPVAVVARGAPLKVLHSHISESRCGAPNFVLDFKSTKSQCRSFDSAAMRFAQDDNTFFV
jgi:hypothetical protein